MSCQKEIIGDATLYLGDCLEIIPTLEKVDAVISDPPYEGEAHTKGRRLASRGQDGGRMRSIENYPIDFLQMTPRLRKRLARACQEKCSGWGLYFSQIEGVYLWRVALEAAGAKYKRAGIWRKPDGAPQFTGDRPGMGFESIVCVWHGEGRSKWNGGGKHGVWEFNKHDPGCGHGGARNKHPTQKPIRLMEALVNDFTMQDATILDPFMGSGTTGVACVNIGRKFIGIEMESKYFDLACERITAVQKQGRFFA